MCLTCNLVLKHKAVDDKKKLVITYSCPKCKYVEHDEIVWSEKKEEKLDENFAVDRDRFCLTGEEGEKYRQEKYGMEQMKVVMEEWKKKDEARDQKLKENPKGFHLDGVGYTCFICGQSTQEQDNWYDKWGIKCLTCQWVIDRKEIPASLAKYKDSWYSSWDFQSCFNIKTPTLRSWVKKGILKERVVTNNGKGIHTHLYLIKDNKDFLPPKKLLESHSVSEVKDGKTWTHMEPWYKFVDPVVHLKGYKIMDYLRIVPEEEVKKDK